MFSTIYLNLTLPDIILCIVANKMYGISGFGAIGFIVSALSIVCVDYVFLMLFIENVNFVFFCTVL